MRIVIFAVAALLGAQATDYRASVEAFRTRRAEEILGPGGWASLVDLHWVTPGTYTIGRDPSNAIALPAPSAPPRLGTIVIRADGATLDVGSGIAATVNGTRTQKVEFRLGGSSTTVVAGGFSMTMIRRGERLALRVWDTEAPRRKSYKGLDWYPVDRAWRLDAKFIAHTPAPRVPILNVLNETVQMANPGAVEFQVKGQTYRLEAMLEGANATELFLIFRDGTSKKTTYGAGRYLYTDLPKDGKVVVDFNRAMNPPCAFTEFATCPLPPASNRLDLPIPAGELYKEHREPERVARAVSVTGSVGVGPHAAQEK